MQWNQVKVCNLLLVSIIMWSILSLFLQSTAEAHHSPIEETLYQYERYVKEERYTMASNLLSKHEDEIVELFSEQPQDVKDELMAVLNTNLHTIGDESFPYNVKAKQTQTLLLAVDAIKNPNDPIWLQWNENLERTIANYLNEEQITQEQIDQVLMEWEIIQPALQVALVREQYEPLASSYQQLRETGVTADDKQALEMVFQQTQLIDIAQPMNDDGGLNFIWLLSVVGGCITLTLSYVTWKKYKGEKNKQKQMTN